MNKKNKPKNHRFRDKTKLRSEYQSAYLELIDQFAPEVIRELLELLPLIVSVFPAPWTLRGTIVDRDIIHWFTTDYEPSCREDANKDFQMLVHITGNQRYVESGSKLTEIERSRASDILELRSKFIAFIRKYYLDTEWLRQDLFRYLCFIGLTNRGFPQASAEKPGKVPLPGPNFQLQDANSLARFDRMEERYARAAHGPKFSFNFSGWMVFQSSDDYRNELRRRFEARLESYIEFTAANFRQEGYKTTRDRDRDYLKWLVHWNVKNVGKQKLLGLIEEDRKRLKGEKGIDETRLNSYFRRFKKHGLPLREEKKGRKKRAK